MNYFTKQTLDIPDSCDLAFQERLENVNYFRLVCGKKSITNFLYFGRYENYGKINSFRFLREERIGNKNFYVLDNLQINHSNKIYSFKNKNLAYLLNSIARNEYSFLEKLNNQYIYFDKNCPLEFISRDSDFHWEKILIYNFRLSCLEPENSFTISLKAEREAEIFLKGKIVQPGEILHARVRIENISDSKITWKNFETIP